MQAIAAVPGSSKPRLVAGSSPGEVTPDAVLCRTLQLGICGTDREILHSHQPAVPPGEELLILGHECLAQVEAVGSGSNGASLQAAQVLQPGDWVVPVVRRSSDPEIERVDFLPYGKYTERGIAFEHGFSQPRWLDEARHLMRVPPSLVEVAVLVEPFSVVEKAINESVLLQQARLGPNIWKSQPPRVLVPGMGPIGFAAALSCLCRGWPTNMYGRDEPETFRARLIQEFGGRYVQDTTLDFSDIDAERDGFDLILECTGSDEVMVRTAQSLAGCGVMVWLGSTRRPRPIPLDVARVMREGLLRNHIHLGTVNAAPRDFLSALERLEELEARTPRLLRQLITARTAAGTDETVRQYMERDPQGIKTVVMYD